jgi:hypothetical protein
VKWSNPFDGTESAPTPGGGSAATRLEQIVTMPAGPERQAAMEAAMAEDSALGRLTRRYLRIVADLSTGGAE